MAGNPSRVKTGDTFNWECGCGLHKFPVKVGDSEGFAEIREAVAIVEGKDGVKREYPGVMVFHVNGERNWLVEPDFGDETVLPEHPTDKP